MDGLLRSWLGSDVDFSKSAAPAASLDQYTGTSAIDDRAVFSTV